MLASSFDSLEWLDIEKQVSFSRSSYGDDKKEYEKIYYWSLKHRKDKYKEIGGVTYVVKDICKTCEFNGVLIDVGSDPVCPGCPHVFDDCHSCSDTCRCPQHPKHETVEEAV